MNDNYGAGAVTSTTISGGLSGVVQYGILAEAESGGTGDVTVNIGANATISTSTGPTGLFGIEAFSLDTGNITVLMSAGDTVTSGSAGIVAVNSGVRNRAIGGQHHHGNGRGHNQFGTQHPGRRISLRRYCRRILSQQQPNPRRQCAGKRQRHQ